METNPATESEDKYSALLSAVQRQAQELALLDRVRTALARELDLSAVIRTVVEAIAQTFGYTQVSLYLLQNNILKFQHQVGYAHVIYEILLSEGIMGKTVRAGQPTLVEDVRAEPAFLGAIEGVVSEICIPLFDEGKVVGALNVESTNDVRLSTADLQLMIALSEHVNIAIGRARLYGEARRYTSAQNELAERKRAEAALAEANIDLEQSLLNANELALAAQAASRAKSEFLANISHEIRTPLNAVLGFTELAQDTPLTAEQRHYVGQIQHSGELLLDLLNGVLDFARIESAQIELESIPFDPVKLIDDVTTPFFPRASAKNIVIKTSLDPAVPASLLGDPTRLRQILINLLNNAVKFTTPASASRAKN